MIDLKKLQQEIYQNKVAKGFNVENVYIELEFLHGELAEVFQAYQRDLPELDEELADVAIYLLGLAEILKIDLETEILKKTEKNKNRKVERLPNGVILHEKKV